MNNLEIKNSQIGYDSTMAPSFRPYIDENIEEVISDSIIPEISYFDTSNSSTDMITTINCFIKLCPNKIIQDFFINNNGCKREIYLEAWTFLSLEKILQLNTTYNESQITDIIDLGYTYYGMGWVVVAFYYIPLKKIYFRMDGGSNGYDRLDNFNRLKNLDKYIDRDNINHLELGIEFNELLNIINNRLDIPKFII